MFAALIVLAAAVSPEALALERRVVAAPDAPASGWERGYTCSIAYYNTCTGWIWAWSGWHPGDRVGVSFSPCDPFNDTVGDFWLRASRGAPAGYGYTGTLELGPLDASGCPADPYDAWPFLPETGWNYASLGGFAPYEFALVVRVGPSPGNPLAIASDHPAIGPAGPIACGRCYPADRATHSFWWGTHEEPLCPGSPLFDGFCNAEILMAVTMWGAAVSTEPSGWGAIKALYR